MNTKQVIEQSAQATRCEIALAQIEQATAIRNDRLSEAFAQRHSDCWREYTTLHRENILADYVAELQTPQFQPYRVGDTWKTLVDASAKTQLFNGAELLGHVFGCSADQSRARAVIIAQCLNESGAVL